MLANKQALFDIRMQKRLTQKDLALASGLSERTINTYESDIDNLRNARYKNVEKVANALGVSVDEIFLSTVSEKPKQKQPAQEEIMEVTIKGTPEEIKKALQAIISSGELQLDSKKIASHNFQS